MTDQTEHRHEHDGEHSGMRIGTKAPGEAPGPRGDHMGPLRDALIQLNSATKQLAHAGTPEQAAETLEILTEARKRIYNMLAR